MTIRDDVGRLVNFLDANFPNVLQPNCNTIDVTIELLRETLRLAKNVKRIELGFDDTDRIEFLQSLFDEGVSIKRTLFKKRIKITDSKKAPYPIRPLLDEMRKGARNESEANTD